MEIKFKRDTQFRKSLFAPDSFAHPAKMDAQLLIWLVWKYTKAGDVILDPMAGSGTTMLACTLGRDCILVELEEKFCKMCCDNWEKVRMRPQLGFQMGDCQIIQGDARNLEGLLADKIITSPPFFNTSLKKKFKSRKELEEFAKKTKLYREGRSLEAIIRMIEKSWNAGEGVDKIITSPPFGEQGAKGFTQEQIRQAEIKHKRTYTKASWASAIDYSRDPSNIGNLPYGNIDTVITSPPYAEVSHHTDDPKELEHLRPGRSARVSGTAGASAENIANLSYGDIDAVITSPPYEGSEARDRSAEGWWDEQRELEKAGGSTKIAKGYQANGDNIGNLKSQSYLEAMLQVYRSCLAVLKSGGLMILVTKNFIRNKQVVRLDTDTIKLCEQAGFKFVERHYRKLPAQSFWRVLYHKKFPDVEQIDKEDILVFRS